MLEEVIIGTGSDPTFYASRLSMHGELTIDEFDQDFHWLGMEKQHLFAKNFSYQLLNSSHQFMVNEDV